MIRLFESMVTSGVTVWPVRVVFSLTLIWLSAALANLMLRRYSAALRHRVWAMSVTASLAVPILITCLPEIRLGWLTAAAINGQPLREIGLESSFRSLPFDLNTNQPWLESSNALMPKTGSSDRPLLSQSMKMPAAIGPKAAIPGVQDATVEPSSEGPVAFVAVELATNATHVSSGKVLWLMLFLVPMSCGMWRIVRSNGVARRLVAEAHPICDSASRQILADICSRLIWNRNIDLKQTARTSIPLCVGWRRPCIVLPEDWRSWSEVTLRAVLAHEVTHIVRRDVAWQGVARIACVLYWFHPFAWLAAWRMRVERESACDDSVLRIVGRPTDYARILVDFARQMSGCPTVPAGAVAMAIRSGLEGRVRAILDANRRRSPVGRDVGCILAVATISIVVIAGSLCPLSGEVSGVLAAQNENSRTVTVQTSNQPGGKGEPKNQNSRPKPEKRSEGAELSGRVVLRSDLQRGVARAKIFGIPLDRAAVYQSAVAGADGRFHLTRPSYGTLILAQNDERTLSGIARLNPDDDAVVIRVGQTVSAHGRLIDGTTGQPVAQCQIHYGLVVNDQKIALADDGRMMFCGVAKSGASGEFTLTNLAPGWNYEISSPPAILHGTHTSYLLGGPTNLARFTSRETETLELGDVKVPRASYPNMLAPEDFTRDAMRHAEPIEDLLKSKLAHARLADQWVLIIAGSPKSEVCRSILTTQQGRFAFIDTPMFGVSGSQPSGKDNAVGTVLAGYAVLGIDLFDPRFAAANGAFLERHKLPLPAEGDAVVAVLDIDGSLVASATGTQFSDGKAFSSPRLGEWLRQHAAPIPDAERLLADALAQAKRDNKRVLVWKNAPRCDPCEQLTQFLDKYRAVLERDYVLLKLDARFAHADRALDRVGHGGISGSPWMAILDADGKLVVTSDSPQGNIGFPISPQEVSYFAWMLRASAQRLSDEEIATLIAPLTKKGR